MKYISGLYALNIPCKLGTTGDWHYNSLNQDNPTIIDTDVSPFADYGIEENRHYYAATGLSKVANHIRACLDMLVMGDYSNLQGMRKDYICTDDYDEEIFEKVSELKHLSSWQDINRFMEQEYLLKWVNFRERNINGTITKPA